MSSRRQARPPERRQNVPDTFDSQGVHHAIGRAYLYYGPFETTTDIPFTWDTANASIGKHTLKVEIPPVPGEQNTEDNVKTVTIEVKESAG